MSEVTAVIDAARGWHKFGYAISATALILLLAPQQSDFSVALDEAYALRSLRIDDFADFVRGRIGQNYLLPHPETGARDWPLHITQFLNSQMNQPVVDGDSPNPTWTITAIVDYEHPPIDGSLADWSVWINSREPASYYHPDWKTAGLTASRDVEAKPIVRHFSVRSSRYNRSPGEYTFRAYLDLRVTRSDQSLFIAERNSREDWWSELESSELDVLDIGKWPDLGPDRWAVQGDVNSVLKTVDGSVGINDWLRWSGVWETLSETDNLSEAVIPGIREHWTQLGGMTLTAAIAFMESAQSEIEAVSLLGIPIPGELCVVLIPLAYLVVHLSLLLDIRFLRVLQRSEVDVNISDAHWMGLYDDPVAVWATRVSVAVVPIALSLGLLVKYHAIVGALALGVGVVAFATSAAIQVLVLHTSAHARKIMADKFPEAVSGSGVN